MRALLVVLLVLLVPIAAGAAPRETEVPGGPSNELYIRKRPANPGGVVLSKELRALIAKTEPKRDAKRFEAIALLRELLASHPSDDIKAEGLYKLGELVWEEARRAYLASMDDYVKKLERCQQTGCDPQPAEPRIDLAPADKLYRELHDSFPNFPHMDLVTYLIGFAANEAGRDDEATARFREVIARFPKSPVVGDAWMQLGEQRYRAAAWKEALAAYRNVQPDAPTYDFALFKRAWCEWKIGDTRAAADDFKEVIQETIRRERFARTKRGISLRDEAIEYLVVVFTEDRAVQAKEVFQFLGSIDPSYSREVLVRVAESYASQAEWDRSAETFRFLIDLDPKSIRAADHQRRIVENAVSSLEADRAQDEIQRLLDERGPRSAWAKAQVDRDALAHSLAATEQLVRQTAMNLHGEAQRSEQALKRPPREGCTAKPDLPAGLAAQYTLAVAAYDRYLKAFPATADAGELRYYRADILCFKLGKLEEAGDAYLAVGKTAPVGKLHREALLNAMSAYEAARPPVPAGQHQLFAVDKKLGEAIDLYATLFHDASLGGVLFKNGQMYYDHGEWGEAVKRFTVIVRKYPDDPSAAAAADRILAALVAAGRYEEVTSWTRELAPTKWFAGKDQKARLLGIENTAFAKIADAAASSRDYDRAASLYLDIHKRTHDPQALMNAGVMYESEKAITKAATTYTTLATTYATARPDIAEKAAFAAAHVYENAIVYDRAATAFELITTRFAKSPRTAEALFEAGVLRQALGEHARAIAHYQTFAKQFPTHRNAPDVAFNIGVVLEDNGKDGPAHQAYIDYVRAFRTGKQLVEAYTRAGRASFRLGQLTRAKEELATARRLSKPATKAWAAEARYYEGEIVFRAFEAVALEANNQLTAKLVQKEKLLDEAEKIYGSVIDYGDPKWAAVALFRNGQIYESFAETLGKAAENPPKNLPPADVTRYQDTLNAVVLKMQAKALLLYKGGYQKAKELGLYDENTVKIRKILGRLAPAEVPPEYEAREPVRIGDRPPAAPIVDTLRR